MYSEGGDYVETSDPEEHEILQEQREAERVLHHISPLRKRIKLDHKGYSSSPLQNVHNARTDTNDLLTPYSPASQINLLPSTPDHSSNQNSRSPSFLARESSPFSDISLDGDHYRRRSPLSVDSSPENITSKVQTPLPAPLTSPPKIRLRTPPLSQVEELEPPFGALLADEPVNANLRSNGDDQDQTGVVFQDFNPDDLYNAPRYSFRRRALAQIKPYTVDKLQYKHALSANPDAIVTNRELRLDDHGQADGLYDKSQALWDADDVTYQHDDDDDASMQAKRRSNPRHRLSKASIHSEESLSQYPVILQGLPITDEEEESSLRATLKEARKAIRARKSGLSPAQGTSEGYNRPMPFPIRNLGDPEEPHAAGTPPLQISSLSLSRSQYSPLGPAGGISLSDRAHTPRTSSPPSPSLFNGSPSPLLPLSVDDEDEIHRQIDVEGVDSSSDAGAFQKPGSDAESSDSHNSSSKMTKNQHKQFKLLSRLYPRIMVERLLNGSSKTMTHRSKKPARESASDEEDEVELLPGQTRTKWAKSSWDLELREVKGDSDSSDSGRSRSENPPDNSVASPRIQSRWSHPEVLDLTTSSEESSDEVDDSRIQSYLNHNLDIVVPLAGRKREESLIDYMLAGTRRVGVARGSKTKTRSIGGKHKGGLEPRYKVDVAVGGIKRGRQTLLGVDHRIVTKQKQSGYTRKTPAADSHRHSQFDTDDIEPRNDVQPIRTLDMTKKGSRKAKQRARIGDNRAYTFTSQNVHVVSGRRETGMITVDTEDHDFHQAIAPLSQDWALQAASTKPKPHISHDASLHSPHHCASNDAFSQPRHQLIRDDFNIPILHSGISFGADTYTGKGMLHELISVIKSLHPPPIPSIYVFQDIELGPATSINVFTEQLGRIFDLCVETCSILAQVRRPPLDWPKLLHVTNQLLSWLLTEATEPEAKLLRDTVQERTSMFVSQMRNLALQASSIDVITLSTCWFAVELFARAGLVSLSTTSDDTGQPIALLVDYLIDYGLEQAISPIVDRVTLDSSTTAQYAAELWVSLFHLADSLSDATGTSLKIMHPFWTMVKGAVESERSANKSNFEASEWIWHSIFCLCALSQFSIHGMTTGVPRLPACWELVIPALKRIRLQADPSADKFLPASSLNKRDRYIGIITKRCFYLWNRWHWQLDNASIVLTQLVEIFRSRKFAGLRHERSEYPSFLMENNWTLLSKHESADVAFTLFLKLLAQAALCGTPSTDGTLPPKIKKLLSITTPVGSLPFSKKTPTSLRDLSMLYNRLGAIAVGVHLDPARHASRITQAQSYVNFLDADETTRLAVIRGMLYLAKTMKSAKLPMNGFKTWIEKMACVLVDDFRVLHAPEGISIPEAERNILQDRLGCYAQTLVRAVHQIIAAYENSEYPEPLLLISLLPIFKAPQNFTDVLTTAEEMRQTVQAFLDARKAVLPQPQQPRLASLGVQESQESQDEYGIMELDYDDPAFLAALGVGEEQVVIWDFAAEEEAMKAPMDDCLVWWAWRNLNKVLDPGLSVVNSAFHRWLDCWLGCVEVSVRAGGKTWKQFLDLTKQWKLPDDRSRRVNFGMWMRVLILDPMTYLENTDEFIETLLMALISHRPTLENSFIQLVISIASENHPLLTGLRKQQAGGLTAENKNREILQAVLNNIAYCLRQVAMGDKTLTRDCEKYVGFCIKMFQNMKDNFLDLESNLEERRKYLERRSDIFGMIGRHAELRTHPRLAHWIGWGRGVN